VAQSPVKGPQRLELVLSKPPVPPGWGRNTTAEVMAANHATLSVQQEMAATRGVFELRPDRLTPPSAASATAAPDQGGFTLWWRPLPAQPTGDAGDPYAMDPTEDPAAVAVVSGLTNCRWLAFKTVTEDNKPKSRQLLDAMDVLQFQDLPAYIQMEVETAGGLTASWMFEVGWSNGPETTEEAVAQGDGVGGGGTGDGGGTTVRGNGNGQGAGGGPGGRGDSGNGPRGSSRRGPQDGGGRPPGGGARDGGGRGRGGR
jgi:hypothetical protein